MSNLKVKGPLSIGRERGPYELAIIRMGLDRYLKLAEWVHQLGRMESPPLQGPDA